MEIIETTELFADKTALKFYKVQLILPKVTNEFSAIKVAHIYSDAVFQCFQNIDWHAKNMSQNARYIFRFRNFDGVKYPFAMPFAFDDHYKTKKF